MGSVQLRQPEPEDMLVEDVVSTSRRPSWGGELGLLSWRRRRDDEGEARAEVEVEKLEKRGSAWL